MARFTFYFRAIVSLCAVVCFFEMGLASQASAISTGNNGQGGRVTPCPTAYPALTAIKTPPPPYNRGIPTAVPTSTPTLAATTQTTNPVGPFVALLDQRVSYCNSILTNPELLVTNNCSCFLNAGDLLYSGMITASATEAFAQASLSQCFASSTATPMPYGTYHP